MPVRVGILSAAHLHVWSYASALGSNEKSQLAGLWDDDPGRRANFVEKVGCPVFEDIGDLLARSDAVVITSENYRHAELAEKAAQAGKHILCEKPLVASEDQANQMFAAVNKAGVKLMTAFPCRFSPAYQRLKERVQSGEIGKVKAICATNQGRCPFDWFVQKEKSGGGAMIDHVVHVADLLRDLLGEEVQSVQAQIGNNMYGQEWEDTAMLSLQFPSGIFATLDSSWSRPTNYKTWGNVNMNVVGNAGVIEMQMFGQSFDYSSKEQAALYQIGFGSNADALMVDEFLSAIIEHREPRVTGWDGLQAARVSLAGYESVKLDRPASPQNHAPLVS